MKGTPSSMPPGEPVAGARPRDVAGTQVRGRRGVGFSDGDRVDGRDRGHKEGIFYKQILAIHKLASGFWVSLA